MYLDQEGSLHECLQKKLYFRHPHSLRSLGASSLKYLGMNVICDLYRTGLRPQLSPALARYHRRRVRQNRHCRICQRQYWQGLLPAPRGNRPTRGRALGGITGGMRLSEGLLCLGLRHLRRTVALAANVEGSSPIKFSRGEFARKLVLPVMGVGLLSVWL